MEYHKKGEKCTGEWNTSHLFIFIHTISLLSYLFPYLFFYFLKFTFKCTSTNHHYSCCTGLTISCVRLHKMSKSIKTACHSLFYILYPLKKACHHNHFVIMPNIFHQIKLLSTLHAPICTPSGKLVQKLINIALSSFPLPHSPLYSWLCTWRHFHDTTLSIQKMSISSHTPLCWVALPASIKLHYYFL